MDDLAAKHQTGRSTLHSFMDDKVWKLALKNLWIIKNL